MAAIKRFSFLNWIRYKRFLLEVRLRVSLRRCLPGCTYRCVCVRVCLKVGVLTWEYGRVYFSVFDCVSVLLLFV